MAGGTPLGRGQPAHSQPMGRMRAAVRLQPRMRPLPSGRALLLACSARGYPGVRVPPPLRLWVLPPRALLPARAES